MRYGRLLALCAVAFPGVAVAQPGRTFTPPPAGPSAAMQIQQNIQQIQRTNDAAQQQTWRIQQSNADARQRGYVGGGGGVGAAANAMKPRVFIDEITPGGQADKVGLRPGDGLLTYAGQLVTSRTRYVELRNRVRAGNLLVLREGAVVAVEIDLNPLDCTIR